MNAGAESPMPALTFALLVGGPPYGSEAAAQAFLFACQVLAQGHRLERVFFYQAGVLNANSLTLPASDEDNLVAGWRELAERHEVALDICVAAALRRGVVDEAEALQAGLGHWNVQPPFCLSGLGQLAEAALSADRMVQF